MAPSPENDTTPKAPDKSDKSKAEKQGFPENNKEKTKDTKTLNNLNDGELKALLDEAMTYKNPKDREGKSELFKDLLIEAEASERNARAASAGGSELVRYCNPNAKRNKGNRRKPSSISENVMHGGSLDNLSKEELFGVTSHTYRTKRSVSARQREGGSLPCNVNAGNISYENFVEEAKQTLDKKKDLAVNIDQEGLLKHDSRNYYNNNLENTSTISLRPPPLNFTSKVSFPVNGSVGVDDAIQLDLEQRSEKKNHGVESISTKVLQTQYSIYIPQYPQYCNRMPEDNKCLETSFQKVDENDNPLQQNPAKNKKRKTDKNVVVFDAAAVEGHRGDIIMNIEKLMRFIDGREESCDESSETTTAIVAKKQEDKEHKKSKDGAHKVKQLHKQHTDDGGRNNKKQRKGKDVKSGLKKSNSLGEIPTSKSEGLGFSQQDGDESDVVYRNNKNANNVRERLSWGNVPQAPSSHNTSSENLENTDGKTALENSETSEFRVVTKKKKSKKRRNSVSEVKPDTTHSGNRHNKNPTSSYGRKYAESVPHSEKSNDSSEADFDFDNEDLLAENNDMTIPSENSACSPSYADIAKNGDKPKEKKAIPERPTETKPSLEKVQDKKPIPERLPEKKPALEKAPEKKLVIEKLPEKKLFDKVPKEKSPVKEVDIKENSPQSPPVTPSINITININPSDKSPAIVIANSASSPSNNNANKNKNVPPDVHNIKNFPAITAYNKPVAQSNPVEKTNNNSSKNISNKTQKNVNTVQNNNKNKTSVQKVHVIQETIHHKDIQTDLSIIQASEKEYIQHNAQMLPPNIPDVQTIEKMHRQQNQQHQYQQQPVVSVVTGHPVPRPQFATPLAGPSSMTAHAYNCTNRTVCDSSERTSAIPEKRPPVIMRNRVSNKDVGDIEFGFDINMTLLEGCWESIMSRYEPPKTYAQDTFNCDEVRHFLSTDFQDAHNEAMSGSDNVKYYNGN